MCIKTQTGRSQWTDFFCICGNATNITILKRKYKNPGCCNHSGIILLLGFGELMSIWQYPLKKSSDC